MLTLLAVRVRRWNVLLPIAPLNTLRRRPDDADARDDHYMIVIAQHLTESILQMIIG
jgi:hypothetical protein